MPRLRGTPPRPGPTLIALRTMSIQGQRYTRGQVVTADLSEAKRAQLIDRRILDYVGVRI